MDLVKGYPHLYNKESKDFKDVNKKNNSWEEIGRILKTTGSDCQIRWTRLRERYSREKKLHEMETRSGSTTRPTFHLHEQMNFLKKFVKSRKCITNLTPKYSNKSTEKIGSNISQNQIRLYNERDIINKPMSKTTKATVSRNSVFCATNSESLISCALNSQSSISCAPKSHFHSDLTSSSFSDNNYQRIITSDNNYQRNIAEKSNKYSKLLKPFFQSDTHDAGLLYLLSRLHSWHKMRKNKYHLSYYVSPVKLSTESSISDDDFLLSHSPNASDNEASLLEDSETDVQNGKLVSPHSELSLHSKSDTPVSLHSELSLHSKSDTPVSTHSKLCKRKVLSELNQEYLDSSSDISPKQPKRFMKKIKLPPLADKIEESFLKLTSVVSSHLENKSENVSYDVKDEDDIFARAVACQLEKIMEPEKSQVKGQIMKIIYNL